MDQPASPRLRPSVRGAFDEETCRMQLHELGNDIVPRYPFAYGIQQIYEILFAQYGTCQIADAISVLHELLQDESYEGNIWRSWRHDWRHRNDNVLDPFVPAVGSFVLPPPTSRGIRTLRGANFSAEERDVVPSASTSPRVHDEYRASYISCHSSSHSVGQDRSPSLGSAVRCTPPGVRQHHETRGVIPSHQSSYRASRSDDKDCICNAQADVLSSKRTRESISSNSLKPDNAEARSPGREQTNEAGQAAFERGHDGPDQDSQQDFVDVSSSPNDNSDPNLLTFEMMTIRPNHVSAHRRTQSDPTGIVVLRPVHSAESTVAMGSNMAMPSQIFIKDHDIEDKEGSRQEYAKKTSGSQSGGINHSPEKPVSHSEVGKESFAADFSANVSVAAEPSDCFEGHPAPDEWEQVTTDSGPEQLLPDRAYLDETSRMSLSAVKSYTVEKTSPSISTVSDRASLYSWRADDLGARKAEHREASVIHGEVLSFPPREPASPTPGRFPIDDPSDEEISQLRPHRCRSGDHGKGVVCSRISKERFPIDGHDEGSLKNRPTSVLAAHTGTQPNHLVRRGRSILQHMPKVFRKSSERKRTHRPARRLREDTSSHPGRLLGRQGSRSIWCSKAGGDSPPKFGPNRTVPAYSFDGAGDEDDASPTMSALDLNKALPPQPLLSRHKTPASSRAYTPSLTHSDETKTRPSTASTRSSGLSRGSSKKMFHRTAHQLVHPDMACSRDPSPLGQLDSDRLLVGSKYDPLASPVLPDTPMTFSSFCNANPFMEPNDALTPPMPVPAIPESKSPDPVKNSRYYSIPQSRSEGQISSPKPRQGQYSRSHDRVMQLRGTSDDASTTHMRGRSFSSDKPQAAESLSGENDRVAVDKSESRKRSRSPVKRFLRIGKSQSLKEIPQEQGSNAEMDKKAGLKLWGDRLRHGFMTNTDSKPNFISPRTESSRSRALSKSHIPISVPPLQQARLYCELELMICTTANRFLRSQYKAGSMSADSVFKVVSQWAQKNRPQVLEFQFDQATQRDLILYNIHTFRFHGEAGTNRLVLNTTMYAWKVMAKEMNVRTFCASDGVIRKHLHDTHKVLEMLGAGLATFLSLQELQVNALKQMADQQKKRLLRQKQREAEEAVGGSNGNAKTRNFTPPTPTSFMSGPMGLFLNEDTLFEDPYEG